MGVFKFAINVEIRFIICVHIINMFDLFLVLRIPRITQIVNGIIKSLI